MWSISNLLREVYGCDHIRRSTRVSARVVNPQDARLLKLPLNYPILLVESINVDQDGKPVEYGVTRFRGDRMELVFEN
jgi:GntR family phosphonate transport system transcriptional regulator